MYTLELASMMYTYFTMFVFVLIVLDLSHNKLISLDWLLDSTMEFLGLLTLSYNRIVSPRPGALQNLSSLHAVFLDHNNITALPDRFFDSSAEKIE